MEDDRARRIQAMANRIAAAARQLPAGARRKHIHTTVQGLRNSLAARYGKMPILLSIGFGFLARLEERSLSELRALEASEKPEQAGGAS
jgi:hypothetical protein